MFSLIRWILLIEAFILSFYFFVTIMTHTKYIEKYSATFYEIIVYDFLKIPYAFYQTLPIAISCSCVVVMIIMLKNNEIMICLTSGMKLAHLIVPYLFVSVIICFFMFIYGDYVNPKIEYVRNNFKKRIIEDNNKYVVNKLHNLWLKEGNTFISIEMIDPIRKKISNIKFYKTDKNFRLIEVRKINNVLYMDNKWVYDKVDTYVINKNAKIDTLQLGYLNASTLDNLMKISLKSPKSLRFKDLVFMINFYNTKGLETMLYKLALYKKISYPLSVIALVVLMVSLCVQYSRYFSYVFIVSKVLIFGFIYWIILSVCESLGKSGLINPFFAVFLPIIMCFVASVMYNIKEKYYF
jgi:lipopolysaccharide export system permease protein